MCPVRDPVRRGRYGCCDLCVCVSVSDGHFGAALVDWTECPPEQAGVDSGGLARALELVARRRAAAQICILRDGQVVLDRSVGCQPDSLFWIFSASKPFVALLVHQLAERGALSLDDAVAAYWPQFGRYGKDSITIRQVLQHRSGVPVASSLLGDALAMMSWDRAVRHVERARPRWACREICVTDERYVR